MKIGVIDSGIESHHRRLYQCKCSGFSLAKVQDDGLSESPDFTDRIGHGTALGAIIHRAVPNAELVCCRIFEKELNATQTILSEAIRRLVTRQVDIINISLGVVASSPSPDLAAVCQDASDRNIPLVCAGHYLSLECYPAFLPTTFGVGLGKTKNRYTFGYIPGSPVEFIANGGLQRVAWLDDSFRLASGTSYATAQFTGIVARLLEQQSACSTRMLRELLRKRADASVAPLAPGRTIRGSPIRARSQADLDESGLRLFKRKGFVRSFGRLAVFPVSQKEMLALLDFPQLAVGKITMWIDFPRMIRRPEYLRRHSATAVIQGRMPKEEELNRFDTLVVGYLGDQIWEENVRFGRDLLVECMKRGKDLFLFEGNLRGFAEDTKSAEKATGRVYVPEVCEAGSDEILSYRYLPDVRVPVLAVIGTGNRQGKFTTQLRIRSLLEHEGHAVSHVSTEPQGELLGADFVFPYGYGGTVSVGRENWQALLRAACKGIQKYATPDIILAGSQGITVPRSYRPDVLADEPLKNLEFLCGILPDATVCAVDPADSVALIEATCESVKIHCGAEPMFYTITPWTKTYFVGTDGETICRRRFLQKAELATRSKELSHELGKPVLDILDSSNSGQVLDLVHERFS